MSKTTFCYERKLLTRRHRQNAKRANSQRLYGISDCHDIKALIFRSIGPFSLLTNGIFVATKVVVSLLGFLYGE